MSDRIFDLVLRLYPKAFQEEYGAEMRRLFHDQLRAADGWPGRLRVRARLFADAAAAAPREHHRSVTAPEGEHRLSEAGLHEVIRRSHAAAFPAAILWVSLGFGLSWLGAAPRPAMFAIYGLLAILVSMMLRGVRQVKRHWRGFSLRFEGDSIVESSSGKVVKSLRREEVERIIEVPGYALSVIAREQARSLWIPSPVDGFETIRDVLGSWAPIETRPAAKAPGFAGHVSMYALFALYAAALLVRSQPIGLVLLGIATAMLMRLAWSATGAPARIVWRVRLVTAALIAILAIKAASLLGWW